MGWSDAAPASSHCGFSSGSNLASVETEQQVGQVLPFRVCRVERVVQSSTRGSQQGRQPADLCRGLLQPCLSVTF